MRVVRLLWTRLCFARAILCVLITSVSFGTFACNLFGRRRGVETGGMEAIQTCFSEAGQDFKLGSVSITNGPELLKL
jgi:hypothetical protein